MTLAFETTLGRCTLDYGADGLESVHLRTRRPAHRGPHPPAMWRLARDIRQAIAGKPTSFAKVKLATGRLPPFHAAVYQALLAIPWGVTLSYGELAARAGRPGAARAVGQAMSRSRWPIVVACHRVIRSDGSLGGYGGAEGARRKRQLLDAELATTRR